MIRAYSRSFAVPKLQFGTMLPPPAAAFHFHDRAASHQGKSARHYRCFDASQSLLLEGRSTLIGKAIPLSFQRDLDQPDIQLVFRKSFALSGKIDIVAAENSARIGVTTRSRKLFDADEQLIGRFHDTRSWKQHFGESLLDAIGQLLIGGGGDSGGNPANLLVFTKEKAPLATLQRSQLPFFPDPPAKTKPGAIGNALKKILPRKLGHALIDITPPIGWTLRLQSDFPDPQLRLLLIASLMAIELNRWSS